MVSTVTHAMPLEEYMRIFEEEGAFEFIEGEIIFMPQKQFGDNHLANVLSFSINSLTIPQKLGVAYVETPFILPDAANADWIRGSRIPDIMYIKQSRITEYRKNTPDWRTKPLALVPDLVVEIASPTDKYLDVVDKVERYLHDGVKWVWLINSDHQTITIYVPGSKQQMILRGDDILTGGEVFPEFQMAVSAIFALIKED